MIHYIFSDKTGTLTQNRMTVSHLFYGKRMIDASLNYETYKSDPLNHKIDYDVKDPGFKELVKMMALSSKATFQYTPSDEEIVAMYKKRGNGVPKVGKGQSPIEGIPLEKKNEIIKALAEA